MTRYFEGKGQSHILYCLSVPMQKERKLFDQLKKWEQQVLTSRQEKYLLVTASPPLWLKDNVILTTSKCGLVSLISFPSSGLWALGLVLTWILLYPDLDLFKAVVNQVNVPPEKVKHFSVMSEPQ